MTAFDLELSQHADFIRRLAARLSSDDARADDLTQETLAAALRVRTRPPRSLRPWLATILKRRASNERRDAARGVDALSRHADAADRAALSALEVAAQLELGKRLMQHVDALDEPLRMVVHMRYFEGLMPRQIAERLDVSVAAVKSRLSRAVDRLRHDLDGERGRDAWMRTAVMLVAPRARTREATLFSAVAVVGAVAASAYLSFAARGAVAPTPSITRAPAILAATTSLEPVASGRRTALAAPNDLLVRGTVRDATAVGEDARLVPAEGVEVRVDVRAPAGHASTGKALEAASPVPLAMVGAPPSRVVHRVTTATDGSFELALPNDAEVLFVGVAATGVLREDQRRSVDFTQPLALVRRPIGALAGVSVDLAGAPVPGVQVTGVRWEGEQCVRDSAISGGDGCFALTPGFEAEWLEIERPGSIHVSSTSPRRLEFGGFEPVTVTVTETARLEVQLLDEAGAPAAHGVGSVSMAWPGPGPQTLRARVPARFQEFKDLPDGRGFFDVPAGVELAFRTPSASYERHEYGAALVETTSRRGQAILVDAGETLALRIPVGAVATEPEPEWPIIAASASGAATVRIRALHPDGTHAMLRTTIARPAPGWASDAPVPDATIVLDADPANGALSYAARPTGMLAGVEAHYALVQPHDGATQQFHLDPGVVWISTRVQPWVETWDGGHVGETAVRSTGWIRVEPGVTELQVQLTPTAHVTGRIAAAPDFEPCFAIVGADGHPRRILAQVHRGRTILETGARGEFAIESLDVGDHDVWIGTFDELERGEPRRVVRRSVTVDGPNHWTIDL